jgi:hypothetical protein
MTSEITSPKARRRAVLAVAAAATLGAGIASAGTVGDRQDVGVLVDTTAGPDAPAIARARAEVARLRAAGAEAQLRVTRSPSETVAAAATLATRGATTLIVHGVRPGLLAPLGPGIRLIER